MSAFEKWVWIDLGFFPSIQWKKQNRIKSLKCKETPLLRNCWEWLVSFFWKQCFFLAVWGNIKRGKNVLTCCGLLYFMGQSNAFTVCHFYFQWNTMDISAGIQKWKRIDLIPTIPCPLTPVPRALSFRLGGFDWQQYISLLSSFSSNTIKYAHVVNKKDYTKRQM